MVRQEDLLPDLVGTHELYKSHNVKLEKFALCTKEGQVSSQNGVNMLSLMSNEIKYLLSHSGIFLPNFTLWEEKYQESDLPSFEIPYKPGLS